MRFRSTATPPGVCACGLLALLAACGGGQQPAPPPDATAPVPRDLRAVSSPPATLFVSFAGATISPGAQDDAPAGQSALCATTVPPFAHEPFGERREAVVAQVLAAIAELFADFDLEITAERPPQGPYQLLLFGGRPQLCGMPDGLAGLAPLDCGNRSPTDVAFVFSEPLTAVEILALAAAHEVGHMFGLPHTMAPCDVMSNFLCPDGPKRFLAEEMALTPDHRGRCGLQVANSHALLVDALRPSSDGGALP